jgi:hypothetical protein
LLKSVELDTPSISNTRKVEIVRGSALISIEGAYLVLVYLVLVFARACPRRVRGYATVGELAAEARRRGVHDHPLCSLDTEGVICKDTLTALEVGVVGGDC